MVTILGGGNGGIALACYLEEKGINVTVWNRSEERIKKIVESDNWIKVTDYEFSTNYAIKITEVTRDLEKAVKNNRYIFVITPSYAHEEIAERLREIGAGGKVIFLMPGRTLGAKKVWEIMNDDSNEYYEAQTILHTCRMKDNELLQYKKKKKVYFSSYGKVIRSTIDELVSLIPELDYVDNYYEVTLNNVGAMLHPTPTLLNIGLVESKKDFYFYKEALSPVIVRYIEKMEKEREAICNAYGAKFLSVYDWLAIEYNTFGDSLYERLQNNQAYDEIKGPDSIEHRYIHDDVKTGLVPLYYMAKEKGIEVPYIENIIALASKLLGIDFLNEGRK